jgi:hypothetical protein
MLSNRFYRSLVLNSFLFISVLLFHHLGGGSFSLSPLVIPLFALSIVYFNARPLKEFNGPGLAATLVVFQMLGHFVFHDSSAISAERMYSSHGIAVVLTYFISRHFEKISNAIDALIEAVLPKVRFGVFNPKIEQIVLWIESQNRALATLVFSVLRGRAPPVCSRA